MPRISYFYGIAIYMYWPEHSPPHFHAVCHGRSVEVTIDHLEVLHGGISPRALGIVRRWGALHQAELLDNWNLARSHQAPKQIPPLP